MTMEKRKIISKDSIHEQPGESGEQRVKEKAGEEKKGRVIAFVKRKGERGGREERKGERYTWIFGSV